MADLQTLQRRREFPTKVTQALQMFIQNRVIGRTLASHGRAHVPLPLRLMQLFPVLRRIPARAIGIGAQPEMPNMQLFP